MSYWITVVLVIHSNTHVILTHIYTSYTVLIKGEYHNNSLTINVEINFRILLLFYSF